MHTLFLTVTHSKNEETSVATILNFTLTFLLPREKY